MMLPRGCSSSSATVVATTFDLSSFQSHSLVYKTVEFHHHIALTVFQYVSDVLVLNRNSPVVTDKQNDICGGRRSLHSKVQT